MTTELTSKKAPGNSILKSLPAEKQMDIAKHAREHTLEETREYLALEHKITASPPTISRFLWWFEGKHEEKLNQEALAGMAEELEQRHPDWTPEKIQSMGQAYFAAYAIRQNNVRMWSQIQSLTLKEKRLALDRDKFERTHIETIIKICNHVKVQEIAEDEDASYTDRIGDIRKIMFGDPQEEQKKSEGRRAKSELEANIQHPTPNIQHPVEGGKGGEEKRGGESKSELEANIQHRTSNIQHPVEGGKGGEGMKSEGRRAKSESEANVQHPTSNIQHPENGAETPTSKHQTPNNIQHSTCTLEPIEKDLAGETPALPGSENLQPSTFNLQRSEKGSMTEREADHAIQAWRSKAKALGVWRAPSEDDAALKAYLTNQDWKRYNHKTHDNETVSPPTRDPRYNPESPWCQIWKRIQSAEHGNN